MSLASWFYKAFTPKKELLDAAKDLIKMIENDREAAKLMAKLDGIKLEMDNANLVRTEWRRLLTAVINDWNQHCGNDSDKLKLSKLDHTPYKKSWDTINTYQYTLRGKGINLAYRLIVEGGPDSDDRADEAAYRMLLLSLTKSGINALNPEVYIAPGLHQAYTYERSEIDLRKQK